MPLRPEEAEREAGSVLTGGGAMVGVATGAAVGSVVAGPVGAVVGGTLGALAGALGGAAAGAMADPADSGPAGTAPPDGQRLHAEGPVLLEEVWVDVYGKEKA